MASKNFEQRDKTVIKLLLIQYNFYCFQTITYSLNKV
jgi:hypothetical protein